MSRLPVTTRCPWLGYGCQPRGVLAQHYRHRVVAACRRIPRGQLRARKPLTSGATRRDPVNPRRWGGEHPPRCCRRIAQRRSTVPTGSDRRRLAATVRGPSTAEIGSHDRPAVTGESASPSSRRSHARGRSGARSRDSLPSWHRPARRCDEPAAARAARSATRRANQSGPARSAPR